MEEERLAVLLAELTGLLSPTDGTASSALDRARAMLANALLSGQVEPVFGSAEPSTPVTLAELSPAEIEAIHRVIYDVSAAPRDASLRVCRRTWPLLSDPVSQSVPAWARGWHVQETFGPFESAEGQLVWFDVRRTSDALSVVDLQSRQLLFTVPRNTLSAGVPPVGPTRIEIPAGSLWLAAARFDSGAPGASLAGLRIRSGVLSLSHPPIVHGHLIGLTAGTVAALQLRLDPGDRRARSAHGGDARSLDVDPVADVTFDFNVGAGARLTRANPAHLDALGNRVRLRLREEAVPRYDARLSCLWFSMKPDRGSVSVDESHSQLLSLAGAAPIRDAGWALPVLMPTAQQPGAPPWLPDEAAGVGALALALDKGLGAELQPAPPGQPMRLDSSVLLGAPGLLSLVASSAATRMHRTVELWKWDTGRRSTLELRFVAPLTLILDATNQGSGAEAVKVSPLDCRSELDRPVSAAGKPVPFFSSRATASVFHLDTGVRLFLSALADPMSDVMSGQPLALPPTSISLSNALAGTSAALILQVGGVLGTPLRTERGVLRLDFALRFVMPSLPDPYAANITRQAPRQLLHTAETIPGRLLARVRWTEAASTMLSFGLTNAGDLGLSQTLVGLEDAPIQNDVRRERDYLPEIEALFPRASGQGRESLRLLDVSSNADLFGVGLSSTTELRLLRSSLTQLSLQGLDLTASMLIVSAFTLPAFQWEPVYNIPNEADPLFPHKLSSATDGGASRFATPAPTLVPVAPRPVVAGLVDEYNRNRVPLIARFTLPFGMVAVAQMRRAVEMHDLAFSSPHFGPVQPDFATQKLNGGLQLSLQAGWQVAAPLGGPSPGLPGATVQTDNSTDGRNVLKSATAGSMVDAIFDATFADQMKMVPVQRIDFAGYGASTFSDWRHENIKGAGVSQVKFEAMVGRTCREVVQVRSRLYPWGAIVVRIITMERTGSGGVFRRDSGWQAASDARYDLPGCEVHVGVVPRLTNIRRIRDTSNVFERTYMGGPVKLVQVVFDADVQIEGVTLGVNDAGLVPARDLIGYVQVLPVGADLTADELNDLLIATGALGGPIDCELNVAQSGLHMHLSRIEVDRTLTLANSPKFLAVARGTADLARAGEWTFVYRAAGEPELHRLEMNQPIPLIRANLSGGINPPYRIADASELYRPSSPQSEYGLLQSSGAQRLLIPQPQLLSGDAEIHGGTPMLFADMYSLAGGMALFPRPERCHPLPTGSALRITGRGKVRLDVAAQPGLGAGEFKVGVPECTLSQSATMRMRSRFAPDSRIRLIIDSDRDPDWSCEFGPVATLADIGDLEELTQVVGTMTSSAHEAPKLKDPKMVFGGPLAPVQTIISFLTAFGLPFPFDVQITNQRYGFKSGWKYVFPKYGFGAIDKALKSGPGLMLEVELKGQWGKESEDAKLIGQTISEHSLVSTKGVPKGPDAKNWHFVFEAEAKLLGKAIEAGVEGFCGGALKCEIGGEEDGKTKLSLFCGLAGVVDLDAVAFSLEGGRSYLLGFEHLLGAKQVSIGGSSEWEVEGAFLEGLAAVKVAFELKTMIRPAEDFHFEGKGTIAIDVTVAWALSKTFEVEIDIDERIAMAAFVAGTLLL
jgi:hypothetical protein